MEIPRGFKGVWIPKEIWLSEDLSLKEKVLLVEIDSLDRDDGCYAKNKHFADFLEISEKHVSRLISTLKDKEKVTIEQRNIKGNTIRSIHTAYAKMGRRGPQKCGDPLRKNAEASISNTLSKTIVATEVAEEFEWNGYLKGMFDNTRDHINVIAYYFQEKSLSYATKAEAEVAIERHLKAASRVAKFSESKIREAFKTAKREYPENYTVETVMKILTR